MNFVAAPTLSLLQGCVSEICMMTCRVINWEESTAKKKKKEKKRTTITATKWNRKIKSGLLMVDLNDHWFALKVWQWNEQVDGVQHTGLIPKCICNFLNILVRCSRGRHSSTPVKYKKNTSPFSMTQQFSKYGGAAMRGVDWIEFYLDFVKNTRDKPMRTGWVQPPALNSSFCQGNKIRLTLMQLICWCIFNKAQANASRVSVAVLPQHGWISVNRQG